MMRISTVGLLLVLLTLAACDQPATPPAPEPEPVSDKPAQKPVQPPVQKPVQKPVAPPPALPEQQPEAMQAVAPKPAAPTKVEPARPAAAPQAKPLPKPSLPPLDLSLPEEVLQAPSVFAEVPSKALLPPLFKEPDPNATSFQLHGKLISNERMDSYWESLEGAELHFEFKR